MAKDLPLIVIWAKHDGLASADWPQFVAAFPVSLREAMPGLYVEFVDAACTSYSDAVDDPVVAFYEGWASISRPSFTVLSTLEGDRG